jgi:hypothetical protein
VPQDRRQRVGRAAGQRQAFYRAAFSLKTRRGAATAGHFGATAGADETSAKRHQAAPAGPERWLCFLK